MNKKELYAKLEEMVEIVGAEYLLSELFEALSNDEIQENLEYIDRNNDLGVFEDVEDDE